MRKAIDEVGNRYGRLTVLERFWDAKGGKAEWVCQCDCGESTVVLGKQLRGGCTRSCGCLRREGNNKLPRGEAAFNAVLRGMKGNAKQRGYDWQLTDEQVRHLTKQPCHYCGAEPSQVYRRVMVNGDYIYSGLDRIDNTKGYIIDNVVPCCKMCNYAKHDVTIEEFRLWVVRLCAYAVMDGGVKW